jgi:peptidoglycan-associated lipoprotein
MNKIIFSVSLILLLLMSSCSSFNKSDATQSPNSTTLYGKNNSSLKDKNLGKDEKPLGDSKKADALNKAKLGETQNTDAVNKVKPDLLNGANSPLSKRSIYFDYDSSAIKSEFNFVLEAHAKYLASNTQRNILIQGNTDERGSSEYNLALGQRRAEAVRKTLSLAGVNESQMEAISYGKENPKDNGHNESAWSQNRRADIFYK